ncbi:tyrosine phosphatase [Hypoxylon sp. FL1284]|nr:tyrosine phosphatase [Hypoxylon sp. FL1284]
MASSGVPHVGPFIGIPGVLNFRDIGGYPISSLPGKMIRQGIVFRSSQPAKADDEAVERIRQLGIKQVYDLRSPHEFINGSSHNPPVREWEGIEKVFAPVFLDEDYSPEAVAIRNQSFGSGPEGFAKVYMDILASASSPSNKARPFAKILSHLASDASPAPLLIHCSAGKDRTGIICALILSLCGVEDEGVAIDYSLTDVGLRPLHETIISNLMKDAAFIGNPNGARRMVLAQKETMLGTLQMIRQRYGSVENCVTSLGLLSADQVDQLRRNMIVDATKDPFGFNKKRTPTAK